MTWLARVLVFSLALLSVSASPAVALPGDELLLGQTLRTAFAPARAVFLVDAGHGITPLEGALVASTSGQDAEWIAGTLIPAAMAASVLRYYVLVEGAAAEQALVGPVTTEIGDGKNRLIDPVLLSEELKKSKASVEDQKKQVAAAAETVRRLQAEADVIGEMQRVRQTEEEVEALRVKIENLQKDIDMVRVLLELVKRAPPPYDHARRERQLTGQIVQLAEAAKNAEANEAARRSTGEAELQRKMALIEETKLDSVENLQRELDNLRAGRLEADSRAAGTARITVITPGAPVAPATAQPVPTR